MNNEQSPATPKNISGFVSTSHTFTFPNGVLEVFFTDLASGTPAPALLAEMLEYPSPEAMQRALQPKELSMIYYALSSTAPLGLKHLLEPHITAPRG